MTKVIKRISPIIFVLSLIGTELFFSISSIIGYEYEGIDSSPVFVIYHIIIFVLTTLLLFIDVLSEKINIKELVIYILPLLLFMNYLLFSLKGFNTDATTWFLYYVLWGVTGTYIGLYFSKNGKIIVLENIFKYIMIIFSISTLIALILLLSTGNRTNFGGANYQTTSYIAAFSYGLSMFYLLSENSEKNKNKLYKFILMIFSFFNLIATILYGGRGAFVLAFVYSIYFVTTYVRNNGMKKVLNLIIIIVIFVIISSIAISNNQIINTGFKRATAFIGDGFTIDWTGSSGRDNVYLDVMSLIKNKPIFGYGMFGYWKFGILPHNIFLEILLGGGIMLFMISLIYFTALFFKISKNIKRNKKTSIIFVLTLYPAIMLMFSGSYITNSLFWMTSIFILNYERKGYFAEEGLCVVKDLKYKKSLLKPNKTKY